MVLQAISYYVKASAKYLEKLELPCEYLFEKYDATLALILKSEQHKEALIKRSLK